MHATAEHEHSAVCFVVASPRLASPSGVEQDAEDWGEQRHGVVDDEDGMGMLHAHEGGVYMGNSQRPAEMVREKGRERFASWCHFVVFYGTFYWVNNWARARKRGGGGRTRGWRFV